MYVKVEYFLWLYMSHKTIKNHKQALLSAKNLIKCQSYHPFLVLFIKHCLLPPFEAQKNRYNISNVCPLTPIIDNLQHNNRS